MLIIYGLSIRKLILKEIAKGFLLFISALILSAGITFLSWKGIQVLYPHYAEMIMVLHTMGIGILFFLSLYH